MHLMDESPAMRMLATVWRHNRLHSYGKLNRTMQTALRLAITADMPFGIDDFSQYNHRFGFEHWGGSPPERWYSLAAETRNRSAARSYAKWFGRPPFIYDRVLGESEVLIRRRLAVRTEFVWEGDVWRVTGFAKDGQSCVACTYHPEPNVARIVWSRVKRRVKLTVADLRADMKARREHRAADAPEAEAAS